MTKSIILLIAGLGFLVATAAATWRTFNFIDHGIVAEGRVASLNAGGSHPEIEFTTRSGERISYPQGGLTFGNRVGDRVKVRYDPADARVSASLDRVGALWSAPIVLMFFSACLLLGARQARAAVDRPVTCKA